MLHIEARMVLVSLEELQGWPIKRATKQPQVSEDKLVKIILSNPSFRTAKPLDNHHPCHLSTLILIGGLPGETPKHLKTTSISVIMHKNS